MKLFGMARERREEAPSGPVCLQCGMAMAGPQVTFCRRCGLPVGQAPRATAALPTCPICYASVGDDGRLPSHRRERGRVDLVAHMTEHDDFPVGDDDYLESLRAGDLIMTGSITRMLPLSPGDRARAEFEGLGAVEVGIAA